jgi:hypothetical protein
VESNLRICICPNKMEVAVLIYAVRVDAHSDLVRTVRAGPTMLDENGHLTRGANSDIFKAVPCGGSGPLPRGSISNYVEAGRHSRPPHALVHENARSTIECG